LAGAKKLDPGVRRNDELEGFALLLACKVARKAIGSDITRVEES
jgi:hypothetical protein